MKKIFILILGCVLLTGCTTVEKQLAKYEQNQSERNVIEWQNTEWAYYADTYYKENNTEWESLENRLREIENRDSEIWTIESGRHAGENYRYITVWEPESEMGEKVIEILRGVVGNEVEEVLKNVIESKDEIASYEKVVNGYGIIGDKYKERVSLTIIKENITLIDKESEQLLSQINLPDFVFTGMYVGPYDNMMQIGTPMTFRHQRGGQYTGYYQVFRKNNGKLTKVKFVVQQPKGIELPEKFMQPLENIIGYAKGENTIIEEITSKIKESYQSKRIKSKGMVDTIKYEINKHNIQHEFDTDLIEVVVEF